MLSRDSKLAAAATNIIKQTIIVKKISQREATQVCVVAYGFLSNQHVSDNVTFEHCVRRKT